MKTLPIKKIEICDQREVFNKSLFRRILNWIFIRDKHPVYTYSFKIHFDTQHTLTANTIVALGVMGITFKVVGVTKYTVTVYSNQVMTSYSSGKILYNDKCTIVYQPIRDENFKRAKY